MPRVNNKKVQSTDPHPKQRTLPQNSALHLFCTQLASTLNDMGLDQRKVLKPSINIPWTKESIKKMIWAPIQEAMYGTNSTTFLHKQGQIETIHKVIMRELGEKHEVEFIPFPTSVEDKETAPLKMKKEEPKFVCPHCGADWSEAEMVGDPEYNDMWLCSKCDKEYGTAKMIK